MKITRKEIKPSFKAFELVITVENQEQFDAIKALSECETTVSNFVVEKKDRKCDKDVLRLFLTKLCNAL